MGYGPAGVQEREIQSGGPGEVQNRTGSTSGSKERGTWVWLSEAGMRPCTPRPVNHVLRPTEMTHIGSAVFRLRALGNPEKTGEQRPFH